MNPTKTAHREQFVPNPKARLREQVHEVMRFKHLARRSEEAYLQWKTGNRRPETGKLRPETGKRKLGKRG